MGQEPDTSTKNTKVTTDHRRAVNTGSGNVLFKIEVSLLIILPVILGCTFVKLIPVSPSDKKSGASAMLNREVLGFNQIATTCLVVHFFALVKRRRESLRNGEALISSSILC